MLRSIFIFLSKATWAKKLVTGWSIAWRMASRFIAGDKLEDALRVIKILNDKKINASLDHLGENTTNAGEARQATQDILAALDALQESGVRANISIKLTQIGLAIDHELCAGNLEMILKHARQLNHFIRIDMEDSSVSQITLELLFRMQEKGYRNVGIVIQSALYRSEGDVRKLVERGIAVRLCKGAYKEPANVAYPKKGDVDAAYDRLARLLLESVQERDLPRLSPDGKFPPLPALATHDRRRIEYVLDLVNKYQLPKDAIEFQMLFGIRRDLQEQLAAQGYPVRVYVPYGTQWYPYFMRRLAERPANVWFFISNFFRK